MVNYSNGKIYKIESMFKQDLIYIDCTTKKYLSQRIDSHRSDYKRWLEKKSIYVYKPLYEIFEICGVINTQITLIETVPCDTKDELLKRKNFLYSNNEMFKQKSMIM